jgi:hypothetical protein
MRGRNGTSRELAGIAVRLENGALALGGSDAVLRILSTGGELLLPDQFPALAFVHPVLLALSRIEKRKDQARFGRAFGAEYLPLLAPFAARGPVFIDATH